MAFKCEAGSVVVWLIPCLKDNYIFLINEVESGQTIVVDPSDAAPVSEFLEQHSLTLNEIWVTHHHSDHIGGVVALKEKFAPVVRGSLQIPHRIPGVNLAVNQKSQWTMGNFEVSVLELPGHTQDHIAYWMRNQNHSLLFSGDVLFGLGCGRLFEGSYEEMFGSLKKIAELPESTKIFCSHEYTEMNLRFSLQVAPDFDPLYSRTEKIKNLRSQGLPTVPLSLFEELETNLFLRTLKSPWALEEFRTLRESRNKF